MAQRSRPGRSSCDLFRQVVHCGIAVSISFLFLAVPPVLRIAALQDNNGIAAGKVFAEGEQLRAEGTAESRRKAIEKYEEALLLWRAVDDRDGEARTLNNIGLVHNYLGEKQKSLDYLNQALMLRHAARDHQGEAQTLTNIGVVYSDLGEKQKALDYYEQALPLIRAVGDRAAEADTLYNIGGVYRDIGEEQKALDYCDQALPLWQAVGDRRGEAYTLNVIGVAYSDLGERQKALDYLNQALPFIRAVGDRTGEAYTLDNIGRVYGDLDDKQRALDYLNQGLRLRRIVGDRRGEAYSLNNIGRVYWALGEKQKALDHYEQALPLFRVVDDPRGEAITLNYIGAVYSDLGEKQRALDYYNQSLPLRRAVVDRRGEAYTLNNIGRAYNDLGEKQKALDYLNQALMLFRAIGDQSGEAVTLPNIARVEHDRGNLFEARAQIETAIDTIESLRTKLVSQDLRASYFASVQDCYDFYIDLLMQMHKQRPSEGFDATALQASERARARSLLEILMEARADIRQGIDPLLLERERSVQQQLNAKALSQQRLLSGKHTAEQAAAAAKEINMLTAEYQEVEAQIRRRSPRYAALTQPVPLSLTEIQQLLDANTLLLEYALGEKKSYLWAVTPTSITSYELPQRAELEAAARRVYELLMARNRHLKLESTAQKRARVARADAEYPRAAAVLSQMILGPVAAQLGKKRLVVISDGALQYVPFAALPVPAAQVSGARGQVPGGVNATRHPTPDTRPLIIEHEIVRLPSASTLAVLRREIEGRAPAAKTIAVLADPIFDQDDERIKAINARLRSDERRVSATEWTEMRDVQRAMADLGEKDGGRLPRLLGTRWEAQRIAALVPAGGGLQALDFAANRATATGAEVSQSQIVHFATHAIINPVHPELSGIVLSLIDEQGQPQDGFLRAHEIYNLKLSADLVVLSACRTGLGKEVKGEGLIGLTRGFMYAGAPRVVVSLWALRDKATAELMARFYEKMLGPERKSAAAALRAAQVEMWQDKRRLPAYFWAAFVLEGEWR